MLELHDIYTALYATAAVLSLAVAFAAWRRRAARGASWVAVLMIGIGIWSATSAAMWQATGLDAQSFWLKTNALGVWMVPLAVLMIALDVAGLDRWVNPTTVATVGMVSLGLDNIEWLNPAQLYDAAFVVRTVGPYVHYQAVPGPLYWTNSAFAFSVMGIGLVILFRHSLRSRGQERTQAAILAFGGLLPFAAGLMTETRALPFPFSGLDLAPLAFLVTGTLWLMAIARGTLLDIFPVAHETLIRQMPDGVIVLDAQSRVVEANPAALSMLRESDVLGRSADEVLGRIEGVSEHLDPDGQRHATLPFRWDDGLRHLDLQVVPLLLGPGVPPARLLILHDVTEERRTWERLELAHTVFDAVNEGIIVLDSGPGMRVIDVNDPCCELLGRSRDEMVGVDARLLRSDRHTQEFYHSIEREIIERGRWEGEIWQTKADGTEFPSWMVFSMAPDETGAKTRIVGFFADISEAKEAERLRHDATHDPLTGLANRAVLDDRLAHALAHAKRVGRGLAVLFADLDYFKRVNDTLGHSQGDRVLAEAAQRITATLRGGDTAARPGGDEFVVITDAKSPPEIEAEARRLREALALPHRIGSQDLNVTVSIGIALYPADGTDVSTLLNHADLAMYGAKRLGRNRIQFFSPELQAGLDRRVVVEKELIGGLEEERCFLLHLPQVDLHTGKIVGAEALVHLRAQDGTVLSPSRIHARRRIL